MLAHSSGLLFASNWAKSGGISVICPDNRSIDLLGTDAQNPLKPNGIALEHDGYFLLAHLGDDHGGIFRQSPSGDVSPVVTHANGVALPPTNFVTVDALGRIWLTVSTRLHPRAADYRQSANTGFIAVAEPGQTDARIVADKCGYTNECVIDLDNSVVYVNETFARRLTRFDLADDGSLSNRETVTTFSNGTYPDGVALDTSGNLWVTSIVSNRIIKVQANGEQELILEDADKAFLSGVEVAYKSNTMAREHLASTGNTTLASTSSLAFGGNDRSTAFIGNLLGDCVHYFETDVQGVAPTHWNAPLGPLDIYLNQQ